MWSCAHARGHLSRFQYRSSSRRSHFNQIWNIWCDLWPFQCWSPLGDELQNVQNNKYLSKLDDFMCTYMFMCDLMCTHVLHAWATGLTERAHISHMWWSSFTIPVLISSRRWSNVGKESCLTIPVWNICRIGPNKIRNGPIRILEKYHLSRFQFGIFLWRWSYFGDLSKIGPENS